MSDQNTVILNDLLMIISEIWWSQSILLLSFSGKSEIADFLRICIF